MDPGLGVGDKVRLCFPEAPGQLSCTKPLPQILWSGKAHVTMPSKNSDLPQELTTTPADMGHPLTPTNCAKNTQGFEPWILFVLINTCYKSSGRLLSLQKNQSKGKMKVPVSGNNEAKTRIRAGEEVQQPFVGLPVSKWYSWKERGCGIRVTYI